MNIGKQIRHYRSQKSVRQEELAEFLGVSAQAVSKWETGAALPDIALLPRIAVYFGVTIDALFRLPDDEQLERIGNALWNGEPMDDATFRYDADLLRRCIDDGHGVQRARVLLALLHNRRAREDHRRAEGLAREALATSPEEHDAWAALIEAHGGACGDEWLSNSSELIEFCKGFLAEHPGSYRALYALIENLLRDDRFDEAEPYIDQMKALPGRMGQSLFYAGDVCFGRGERERAIALWHEAFEADMDRWQTWCARADRMKKLGQYEDALADYAHCYEMQPSPRLTDGLHSRAQLLEQLGRFEEAADEREKIIGALRTEYGVAEGDAVDEQRERIRRLRMLAAERKK